MVIFHASGRAACCKLTEPITSGSVGMPVEFQFDEAWDGLTKTANFTGSGVSIDQVIGADNALVVPWECLADEGGTLIIGVTGTRDSGAVVIPTVLVRAGVIVKGAAISGAGPHDPTPSWAVQVQEEAAEALEKATAVEEAAARGDFDGEDGADGAPGQDGQDGQDGVSPGVTVTEITGGHRVTITDAEHPGGQTFDVMDGAQGPSGVVEYKLLGLLDYEDLDESPADTRECSQLRYELVGETAPEDFVDLAGFIRYEELDGGSGGDVNWWFGTRAQYDALPALDPDTVYCIEEGT